jgi:hypothetical protein
MTVLLSFPLTLHLSMRTRVALQLEILACVTSCPGSRIRYRGASIGPSFRRHKASSDCVDPPIIG